MVAVLSALFSRFALGNMHPGSDQKQLSAFALALFAPHAPAWMVFTSNCYTLPATARLNEKKKLHLVPIALAQFVAQPHSIFVPSRFLIYDVRFVMQKCSAKNHSTLVSNAVPSSTKRGLFLG